MEIKTAGSLSCYSLKKKKIVIKGSPSTQCGRSLSRWCHFMMKPIRNLYGNQMLFFFFSEFEYVIPSYAKISGTLLNKLVLRIQRRNVERNLRWMESSHIKTNNNK